MRLFHRYPGAPASPKGRRRFLPGRDAADFLEGEILVTTITDPTMVGRYDQSGRDRDRYRRHYVAPGNLVSREMGIPCVVNTREATTKIKDGMRLRIDGGEGRSLCAGLKSIQTEHFNHAGNVPKHFSRSTFLFLSALV